MTSRENPKNETLAEDYLALGERAASFDVDLARSVFDRAEQLGASQAQKMFAELLDIPEYDGPPIARESEDPFDLHERLMAQTDAGDMDAANELGTLLANEEMYDGAIVFHEQAALTGHVEAQNNLGADYEKLGDIENAIVWYKKAAIRGYPVAQNNLATVFMRQSQPHLAMPWLKRAAEAGNTNAQLNIAEILANEGAYGDALNLLLPLADSNNVDAQNGAGAIYATIGETNLAKKYWLLATRVFHPLALFNLGALYKNLGETELAIGWFKLAAGQGNLMAQQALDSYDNDQDWALEDSSDVYEKSLAAEAAGSHEEARRLLEVSARAGWLEAQYDLGLTLLGQWSTEENTDDALRDEAMGWFVLAARSGDPLAIQELKDNLTEDGFKALNL